MKKKLIGVLLLFFAFAFVSAAAQQGGSSLWIGLLLAAVSVFFGLRCFGLFVRRKKAQSKPRSVSPKSMPSRPAASAVSSRPLSAPAPAYCFVNFNVAGTSFKNDDGSDRQSILRHIKFQDSPYVTGDNVEVHIQPYDYNGQPAYRCLVNGYTIGNVPKDKIADVAEAMRHDDAAVSGFEVVGGGKVNGEKLNYGCSITVRYKKT